VKKRFYLASAAAVLLFAGCSTPQTPEEYRAAVRKYPLLSVDTMQIDRPLSEVTKDFKTRAPECLNIRVSNLEANGMSDSQVVTRVIKEYHASVVENPGKTELYVQETNIQGVHTIGKRPKDGFFVMVADAVAVGDNKTELTLYHPTLDKPIGPAVEGWATGKNLDCPFQAKK